MICHNDKLENATKTKKEANLVTSKFKNSIKIL